jgi:membrane-associated phospholipid phosphatase
MLHVPGPSVPSGHASYAGATAVAIVLLFSHPGTHRLIWWSLAGLAIAGMAWSRTYLQVHWLSDVLAGALLGIDIALASFATAQIVWPRQAEPSTATSAVRPCSGTGP